MKQRDQKKKKMKHRESSNQIYALETIQGGIKGIYTEQASKTSPDELEKKFGQSPVFIASTLLENGGIPDEARPASLLKEAIQVISCGYEDKTDWGKEVRRKKFKVLKTFH